MDIARSIVEVEQNDINRHIVQYRTVQTRNMPSIELEQQILNICEQKLLSIRPQCEGDLYYSMGQAILSKKIQTIIHENQPIEFLLPGFPCKSPNLNKVSGRLPDAAEIYALEYLNNICQEISDLYEPGCHLMIWSDGRLFNDLINVPLKHIQDYQSTLKHHSQTMRHIQWDNLDQHLSMPNAEHLVEIYGTVGFDVDQWLSKSHRNRKQFECMKEFMENDVIQPIEIEEMNILVRTMIRRNDALTNLLKYIYPQHIRLSVHQHSNHGDKYAIQLFSNAVDLSHQHLTLRTPWHNVLLIDQYGQKNLISHEEILRRSHECVPLMFNEQIWCYLQVPSNSPEDMASFIRISSINSESVRFGLAIDLQKKIDAEQIDVRWMKMLMNLFGLIVLRQCRQSLTQSDYIHFCEEFGPSVQWKFGPLLSIKPALAPENSHETRDALAPHFDLCYPPDYLTKTGLYKDYVPQYLMLYCVKTPGENAGGKTNMINGRLLLESLSKEELKQLERMTFTYSVSKSFYGGQSYTYPMIMSHPLTGEKIFRYLLLGKSSVQSIDGYCSINGERIDEQQCEEFITKMKILMNDPRWYIEHSWQEDDLVIVENHLLLHGRTEIHEETERELWRVQIY